MKRKSSDGCLLRQDGPPPTKDGEEEDDMLASAGTSIQAQSFGKVIEKLRPVIQQFQETGDWVVVMNMFQKKIVFAHLNVVFEVPVMEGEEGEYFAGAIISKENWENQYLMGICGECVFVNPHTLAIERTGEPVTIYKTDKGLMKVAAGIGTEITWSNAVLQAVKNSVAKMRGLKASGMSH